jgi:hypothetical protein
MMNEVTNPFFSEPFQITSHRPRFTLYDEDGNPEEPIGYVSREDHNFDQEDGGGNYYFNLFGDWTFDGNGRVIVDNSGSFHAPEYWTEEPDDENDKDFYVSYGMVFINLYLTDRWEDHIPFKGVSFTWNVVKETIKTEQEFTLVPPQDEYPFGIWYWTSTPGSVVETERTEESEEIGFTLPDDFEAGKHDFYTFRDLSEQQMLERGHIYPGKDGTFHDGTDKYGFDSEKIETDLVLKENPSAPDPSDRDSKYRVVKKITITYIRYKTSFINGEDDPEETCSPPAFYNQQ